MIWRSGRLLLAPPGHVGLIAERADHQDAGALARVDERAGEDRHRRAKQRGDRGLAEQRPGSARRPDARSRPRRRAAARGGWWRSSKRGAASDGELDVMIGARDRALFDLGLCDRGLEVDVPHRRRVRLIDVALVEADRGTSAARSRRQWSSMVEYVWRQSTRQSEALPQRFERLLVLRGQRVAQLDEVRAGDRRGGPRWSRSLAGSSVSPGS